MSPKRHPRKLQRAAPPPKEKLAPRGRPTPPGGKPRSRADVLRLIDLADECMSHRMSVGEMRRVMGQALAPWTPPGQKPPQMPPLPKRTVMKYKARVLERRQANPLPNVEEAREDAIRRVTKLIGLLRAAGAVQNADKIIRAEHELAMLQGTEQPKTLQLTGPDGGALEVKSTPEVIAAFNRLAEKTAAAG